MQLQFFKLQIKWASGGSIAHGPVGVHGDTDSPRLASCHPVVLGQQITFARKGLAASGGCWRRPEWRQFVPGQPREAQNQELRVHTRPRGKTSKNE